MLFRFPGEIEVSNLESELKPFVELLQREGLVRVTGMYISLLGWREDARCQIRDEENLISEVSFDRDEDSGTRSARPGVEIKDRPADLEWHPLASIFNHDD
jgi:hypothetical protein